MASSLDLFSRPARAWFASTFQEPTEVQERGWAAVASGRHTLMTAPTGSGKTLASFFWCLDRLASEPIPADAERCRVLYISPLKALTVDVDRNLQAPLVGIARQAEREGAAVPEITTAVRTGDTPAQERRQIERHPPDILITTPESCFLMLTSAARRILKSVRWVIVDEIHSLADNKRGAHLALSLERLCALTDSEPQRIGLSATQRPLEEVGRFLVGSEREVEIVDAGRRKPMDITVEVPVEDMANLGREQEWQGGPASALPLGGGGPMRSIWPAIYPRLLELILAHRSTIVFVNSRRLAERLAARLNEMANADEQAEDREIAPSQPGSALVRAHHGSIAREQRVEIEDALKGGRLRAIVATSSLELGIDMGAVDLVVQVESPSTVSRGIQRIGRAGHSVGEVSQGTILPKYRGDLLECAVVVERMLQGEIEATVVPRNPLDVLAQQLVAMAAMDEWKVDDVLRLARRAYPFRDLSPRVFEATLDMLAGRYPSEEFGELRPRVVWDRVNGTIRGRAGAQRLAVTSGGTIPDRGLYTVNLLDDGRRVGELDEEMVFETRPGETFILGASTWRIAEITQSQVLVTPAPGEPGKVAFWHGDSEPRPLELGRALGAEIRELRASDRHDAAKRLRERARFDERAVNNVLAYLDDQAAATGAVPDDRTIVVERFRDEVGDWRICILTPFGALVHAPWALALQARLAERLGMEVQVMYTDDGLILRLPENDSPVPVAELLPEPEEVTALVEAQLPSSAVFASHFRENAARALLLPRRRPGQRTPLWQQRQRSAYLLQAAGRHADFPILLETYRECLSEVFDTTGLKDVLRRIRSREIRVAEVETEHASPFASSLLFDYVGQYLYEGDAPLAERRAQALTLDRELLSELLGAEELRELLDPQAIAHVELELQMLSGRAPRNADDAADMLRRLGDLSTEELEARGVERVWLERLEGERRAVRVRLAGVERWIAAEDAGRYRDACGVQLPGGLPQAFLERSGEPLHWLLKRWARTHVPFTSREPAARWALARRRVEEVLEELSASGDILVGAFLPSGDGREYCHPDVLRALRRRSLAALRREIEPVPQETLARFVPSWQGASPAPSAAGLDRLLDVVFQLQGVATPASVLEHDVFGARVRDYSPRLLDELISMGEVVWIGRGALGAGDGRVALYLRSELPRLAPDAEEPPSDDLHTTLREHLASRGASFFIDLYRAAGGGNEDTILDALWDLVWAGEVTNDTFAPLRVLGKPARHSPRRPRLPRLAKPRAAGRWSLVRDVVGGGAATTERLHSLAGALLQRYGVLTREAVSAEASRGGFSAIYPVLRAMEESGRIRRGYFVEGLGGSQFALPGAVDRLRAMKDADPDVLALAATDPANLYGAVLPWPAAAAGRTARVPGAYVLLDSGVLRLYLERGGRSLLTFGDVSAAHVGALAALAGRDRKLEIEKLDGEPVHGTAFAALLRDAGFGSSPRGMVRWPEEPRFRAAASDA